MSKKRNNKHKNKKQKFNPHKINKQLMPIVNSIKGKIDYMQGKYDFTLDFAFPEIRSEEISP